MSGPFLDSWERRGSSVPANQLGLFVGSPCLYCNKPIDIPTRDHIYPRSLGGGSGKKNIVIVCQRCNQDKGNLPLFSWHRLLVEKGDLRSANIKRFMRSLGYKLNKNYV